MTAKRVETVTLHGKSGCFGPVDWKLARMFWAYGLIPKGTTVRLEITGETILIESCEKLNAFPKRLVTDTEYFKGSSLLSQRAPVSAAQISYLQELGWPFDITTFNYYQIDLLRKSSWRFQIDFDHSLIQETHGGPARDGQ